MAYTDVKITDLAQVSNVNDSDLFLVSHPLYDATGVLQQTTPYSSNSISGGALSSTLKTCLENDSLNVVDKWSFKTTSGRIPTQNVKLDVSALIRALETPSQLTSITNDTQDGWYKQLPTSFLQQNGNPSDTIQSISVNNNSIPNIDFVNKVAASVYQSLLEKIEGAGAYIKSHVGQIIHSTTLSSEVLVRNVYGSNTIWIQHVGYFLKGADTNVVSSYAYKTSGDISCQIDTPLAKHEHNITAKNTSITAITGETSSGGRKWPGIVNGVAVAADRGGSTAAPNSQITLDATWSVTPKFKIAAFTNNLKADNPEGSTEKTTIPINPPYKNVYIWERTH